MFRATTALMTRELRSDLRSLWPHLFRFGLVGFLYFVGTMIGWEGGFGLLAAPGLVLFSALCAIVYGTLTLAGVSFLATAITEEKEQQSLGLLRLAGGNSLTVLAGKVVPRLVFVNTLLGTSFPFTLFLITLGGVTFHQIAAMYVALFAYGVLLAGTGALASVLAPGMGTAAMLGILFGPCLTLNGYFIEFLKYIPVVGPAVTAVPVVGRLDELTGFSIIGRLSAISQTGYAEPLVSGQFIWDCSVGLAAFALACVLLPRFADRPATRRRVFRVRLGRFRLFAPGRAWRSGIVWKDFYFIGGGTAGALFWILPAPIMAAAMYALAFPVISYSEALFSSAAFVIGLALVYTSVQIFGTEAQHQTLSTLLLVPKSLSRLVFQKIAGCLLAVLPASVWHVLLFLDDPNEFLRFVKELIEDDKLLLIPPAIFGLTFAAYLSTMLYWKAAPVAFLAVWVIFIPFAVTVEMQSLSPDEASPILTIVFLVPATIAACRIGPRLRKAAAK